MKKSDLTKMIHEAVEKALKERMEMEEGLNQDRTALISRVELLGKKIAARAAFSKLPDGSLAVVVSNLEAIASKLN